MKKGKLIFFTGKMGAGKTTLAKTIAEEPNTIYISEDEILSSFYPDSIHSIEDYITYSKRIKPYVERLVKRLTDNGLTVVMDFPGNTFKQRKWFQILIDLCNVDSTLKYLDVSDEVCIQQIVKRKIEEPERHAFDNEEMFHKITAYFQEPTEEEGFHIEIIK